MASVGAPARPAAADAALAAAAEAGHDAAVCSAPWNVRWLLEGRGRPVDATAPASPYTVVLADDLAAVLVPNVEAPRVAAEERLEELGWDVVEFPWYEGPEPTVGRLLGPRRAARDGELEDALRPARLLLGPGERERYRAAGAGCADAVVDVLRRLAPGQTETQAAALLAAAARERGFVPAVVLVAGEERQPVHRHPLPTAAPLGRRALLALTAERDGLHVSLTRLVSFGPVPAELERLARAAAAVDAALLGASSPGRTLGELFGIASRAYAGEGFPGEWRLHHQGGLTGYRGREVFATPGEATPLPASCAVAWNPSITGGAKSEDTALVAREGIEVVTRTPGLPEWTAGGHARPAVVEL